MDLPTKILALLIALAFDAGIGYGAGHRAATNKFAAQRLAAEREANAKYRAEVERGNKLAVRLYQAESAIQTRTVEVIKYVPKVTTGRTCLSSSAVRVLNSPDVLQLPEAARLDAPENAGPSASDTDVYQWIAEAQGSYDRCAERVNALIDFEEGKTADGP